MEIEGPKDMAPPSADGTAGSVTPIILGPQYLIEEAYHNERIRQQQRSLMYPSLVLDERKVCVDNACRHAETLSA